MRRRQPLQSAMPVELTFALLLRRKANGSMQAAAKWSLSWEMYRSLILIKLYTIISSLATAFLLLRDTLAHLDNQSSFLMFLFTDQENWKHLPFVSYSYWFSHIHRLESEVHFLLSSLQNEPFIGDKVARDETFRRGRGLWQWNCTALNRTDRRGIIVCVRENDSCGETVGRKRRRKVRQTKGRRLERN